MENEVFKPFALSGLLGFILAGGWIAAYFLSGAWARIWAWIDDSKASERNALTCWVMKKMGWVDRDSIFCPYAKGAEISDGAQGFFYPFLFLLTSPTAILIAVLAYPLTIGCFTIYLIARLARFARRHKKLFDKHIKDPEAHK